MPRLTLSQCHVVCRAGGVGIGTLIIRCDQSEQDNRQPSVVQVCSVQYSAGFSCRNT